MKRIAIFADGTWCSPERGEATNVLLMARGVKPTANGIDQIAFYDWGIGTDGKTISGGLSGDGINKNIMDCYRFIVHNYEIGDELYFFGFSRGAYTVRSLAGFIRNCGILHSQYAAKIPEAFKLYRKRTKATHPHGETAVAFRKNYAVADTSPIHFIGVLDTVGALGIPVPFWGTLAEEEYLFHDTEPSSIIEHARHAVSIDEDRVDFKPTLWDAKATVDLQEVWFAGTHSDVGGGYKQHDLSDCANQWMLKEATTFGLEFEDHLLDALHPNPEGKLHLARKGIFRARGKHVRDITGPIHVSVKERWLADSQSYQKKSKSLQNLLAANDNDWSKIQVVT